MVNTEKVHLIRGEFSPDSFTFRIRSKGGDNIGTFVYRSGKFDSGLPVPDISQAPLLRAAVCGREDELLGFRQRGQSLKFEDWRELAILKGIKVVLDKITGPDGQF